MQRKYGCPCFKGAPAIPIPCQSLCCHIKKVPVEVMRLIFGYLEEIRDIASISLVCKQWNIIIWSCVKKLAICLRKKSPWETLSKMTRLRTLEIDASNTEVVNQERIDNSIGKLEDLRKLCIERCSNQLRFYSLKKLLNLESLSLYDCIKLDDISFLSSAKKLKKLCLSKCMLSEHGYSVLATLEPLQRLYLWHTSAQDTWVEKLSQLTNLDTLDISGNPCLTNECIEHLTNLRNLTLLDTSNTVITIEGVVDLKKHSKNLQIGYKGFNFEFWT